MGAHRGKFAALPKLSPRAIRIAALVAVAAAVIIGLCISIFKYQNIHRRYTAARSRLGDAVYQNLYMLVVRSEELTLTGTDVQGTVLPAMREYFAVATELNTVLSDSYGARYAVLSAEDVSALRRGFDNYDAAFRGGLDTDEARAQLTAAIGRVQAALTDHYDGETRLKPGA